MAKNKEAVAAVKVIERITAGLDAKKCKKCGRMAAVIEQAQRAFAQSEDADVRALADAISTQNERRQKQGYSSLGCGGCWGDKAKRSLKTAAPGGKNKEPATIEAKSAKAPRDDPAGRFEVEIDMDDSRIHCRHYDRKGRLTVTLVGDDAASIAGAAVKMGLVGRLQNAALLGIELARAEAEAASNEADVE